MATVNRHHPNTRRGAGTRREWHQWVPLYSNGWGPSEWSRWIPLINAFRNSEMPIVEVLDIPPKYLSFAAHEIQGAIDLRGENFAVTVLGRRMFLMKSNVDVSVLPDEQDKQALISAEFILSQKSV